MNLRRSRPMDASSHSMHRIFSRSRLVRGCRAGVPICQALSVQSCARSGDRCNGGVKRTSKAAASSDRYAGAKGADHQTVTVEERLNGARLIARVFVLREELDATGPMSALKSRAEHVIRDRLIPSGRVEERRFAAEHEV